jgi:hypothetical protein
VQRNDFPFDITLYIYYYNDDADHVKSSINNNE